jgi:tetratricopeptide (TPR) repeat protein
MIEGAESCDDGAMSVPYRNAVAALATLFALAGVGCSHPDMSNCSETQTDPATLVSACSAAIASGRLGESDLSSAYLGRARGYMDLKKYDLAIADLDTLILKQPGNFTALGYRGAAHGMKGELDLAYSDFEQQTRLAPNDDRPWVDIGKVYQDKHDYPKAQESFSHAIELRSNNPVSLNARCWVRAVVGKELDEAMADCDRSLKVGPDDANTLNSRGFVHFRKKEYGDAIRDYDASIDSDPKLASSYYVRGLAKRAMGQVTDSDDIARGISLEPGVADRYAGYGIPAAR